MNVLILGSGGREHTLAWKIAQSPRLGQLYALPGNPGTALCGINLDGDILDFDSISKIVKEKAIDMIVVGPEAPLVEGIADYFNDSDVIVVGPSREGARLEGSKSFAKAFMKEYDIPTAAYVEVTRDNLDEGHAYLDGHAPPYVLKADGLAGGKGVLILDDVAAAKRELSDMLDGKFGDASSKVVIEEFLDGTEFSVFVLTDGTSYKILPVAKDYKRIGEGDTGLNTGGMGAVSPVPFVDDAMMKKVEDRIIKPTIAGLNGRKIDYQGFIFLGLIDVGGDPKVIEYNCRMGDPETEVVVPRIANDFLDILAALGSERFGDCTIEEVDQHATTVMLVSGGYPESYEKGKVMSGVEDCAETIVFHAGTKHDADALLTNGGRVMALTALGSNMEEALASSMSDAAKVTFEGKYYRTDIGKDLM